MFLELRLKCPVFKLPESIWLPLRKKECTLPWAPLEQGWNKYKLNKQMINLARFPVFETHFQVSAMCSPLISFVPLLFSWTALLKVGWVIPPACIFKGCYFSLLFISTNTKISHNHWCWSECPLYLIKCLSKEWEESIPLLLFNCWGKQKLRWISALKGN